MVGSNMNELDARAQQASHNLNQYDESTQFAIMKVLPNFLNGAFWGFVSDNEMQRHIKKLNENSNITLHKIQGGYIVEIVPAYCANVLHSIDSETMTSKDIQVIKQSMADAQIAFEKFLINKGKAPDKQTKQPYQGIIGVYCVNDVTTICHKGTNYPAFRLNAYDFCSILAKYQYKILINNQWVDPMSVANDPILFQQMTISPTKTGAFVQIATTVSYEQMKQAEKNFKAMYGLK